MPASTQLILVMALVQFAAKLNQCRFLLRGRHRLPHVNCYPAAERLRGRGGDSEATEHGDTPRAYGCEQAAISTEHGSSRATTDLAEFVRVTGCHRKHALRALNGSSAPLKRRQRERLCDEAAHQALTTLWEASDRIAANGCKSSS
jgi:hypothetical protein